jgi:hypothetical protein
VLPASAEDRFPSSLPWFDRIIDCHVASGSVSLTTVDINASSWRVAADDTLSLARSLHHRLEISVTHSELDLRKRRGERTALPPCDCLIVQNCLNEITANEPLEALICELEDTIASGGFMLLSDFTAYPAAVSSVSLAERITDQRHHYRLARFDPNAPEQKVAFTHIPRNTYFELFGFQRNSETRERIFPEYCTPRRRLKFSVSASRKP